MPDWVRRSGDNRRPNLPGHLPNGVTNFLKLPLPTVKPYRSGRGTVSSNRDSADHADISAFPLGLVRRDEAAHLSAHDARHCIAQQVLAAENILGGHVEPRGVFDGLHLIPARLLAPRKRLTAVRHAAAEFPLCVLEAAKPGAEFGVGIGAGRRSGPGTDARKQ